MVASMVASMAVEWGTLMVYVLEHSKVAMMVAMTVDLMVASMVAKMAV